MRTNLSTLAHKEPETARTGSITPSSSGRSLFSTFRELERMMEESFDSPFFGMPMMRRMIELGTHEMLPKIDMYEEGNEVVVKADLPGMTKEDITVTLKDNILVLSGDKKKEEKVERKDYLRVERSHGGFTRTIHLPDGIDSEHINATYKEGVLEIRMTKTDKNQSVHTITVH